MPIDKKKNRFALGAAAISREEELIRSHGRGLAGYRRFGQKLTVPFTSAVIMGGQNTALYMSKSKSSRIVQP